MPFAAVTAAALIIGLLFTKQRGKFPFTPVTIVWIVFIVWLTISTFTAINIDISLVGWKRAMKIQIVALLTLIIINNRDKLNKLIWVIVLSISFFGIKGGIFVLLTGGSYRVWGPPESFIEGNNELALALLMILPLMWYLREQSRHKLVRHGLTASILLCILAIISSYSRGAFVAAIVVMGMFWLKSNKKILIGSIMAVVVVAVLSFMPHKYFSRLSTIENYTEDASAMGRINAWNFAVNLAADHPLTGGGFGTFTKDLFLSYAPNPYDFHDAHSIYFELLAEQGYIGLLLFLLMFILSYKACANIKKDIIGVEGLQWAGTIASMTQVSMVAYGVGGAFLGLAYFDLPYHIIAIAVICQ
jgi:probable O-glycosylation ligase (exosortase A-associated)